MIKYLGINLTWNEDDRLWLWVEATVEELNQLEEMVMDPEQFQATGPVEVGPISRYEGIVRNPYRVFKFENKHDIMMFKLYAP